MKIKNITNESGTISQEIRLPLLKKGGSNANVTLKAGECVYIEYIGNNSVLRLYETKRILKVTQEEPSSDQTYYKVYNNNTRLEKAKQVLKNVVKVFTKEEDVSAVEETHNVSLEEELNKALKEESKDSDTTVEVEVIVPEESIKEKNKGGRPKGSKNKPKRGRPKSKRKSKKKK